MNIKYENTKVKLLTLFYFATMAGKRAMPFSVVVTASLIAARMIFLAWQNIYFMRDRSKG
jgi:hypothetical protein